MTKLIESDETGTETADFMDIDGAFQDVSDLENDVEAQINKITQEFGGESGDVEFKIHVKRILEGKGDLAHLFSCLPNELPILDKLRDEYDGGNFEIWIYKNGRIFKRRKVVVEAPIKKRVELPNDNTAVIIAGFEKLGELIAKTNAPVAPTNSMDMMQGFMQQMVLMKQFMGDSTPVKQIDPFSMVEKVISMQALLGENRGTSEGATNSDVLIELMKTFGKPIAEMTLKATEAQANGSQVNSERTIIPDKSTPNLKTEKESENNPMKMHLMFLTNFAKKNVDPAPYAQMVIDQTDDVQGLIKFISGSDAIEKMSAIHKPVADYAEWFTELGECIVEFAKENLTESETVVDTPSIEGEIISGKPENDASNDTSTQTATETNNAD